MFFMGKNTNKKDKKKFNKKKLLILFAVLVVLAALYFKGGYISSYHIETTNFKLTYNNLPKAFNGFRIVQVSDLHNALFNTQNYDLTEAIEDAEPDIVVLTGDMVNYGTTRFERTFSLLEKLAEKYEVYYIFGNHEQNIRAANMLLITDKMEELGIKLLFNESVEIKRGGESIMLHGLCQYKKSYRDPYYSEKSTYDFSLEEMKGLLGESSDELVDVLLAHNPMYFDIYSQWGADLVLSGHIHGGHWRIPFVNKGILSPNEELFPEYDSGEYIKNTTHMIVSRGINNGSEIIPRLFNRPELVVVSLYDN